uniref:Uncharacterized protein n=1 Tax=Eutreptiella gymnastica TaxID=73025 RepID=A0A7S4G5D1_9EUGL
MQSHHHCPPHISSLPATVMDVREAQSCTVPSTCSGVPWRRAPTQGHTPGYVRVVAHIWSMALSSTPSGKVHSGSGTGWMRLPRVQAARYSSRQQSTALRPPPE